MNTGNKREVWWPRLPVNIVSYLNIMKFARRLLYCSGTPADG